MNKKNQARKATSVEHRLETLTQQYNLDRKKMETAEDKTYTKHLDIPMEVSAFFEEEPESLENRLSEIEHQLKNLNKTLDYKAQQEKVIDHLLVKLQEQQQASEGQFVRNLLKEIAILSNKYRRLQTPLAEEKSPERLEMLKKFCKLAVEDLEEILFKFNIEILPKKKLTSDTEDSDFTETSYLWNGDVL